MRLSLALLLISPACLAQLEPGDTGSVDAAYLEPEQTVMLAGTIHLPVDSGSVDTEDTEDTGDTLDTEEPDTGCEPVAWFADQDRDGYGDITSQVWSCIQPSDYVSDATDCDDTLGSTYPGAPERCDLMDQDCDGQVDEDLGDSDADGLCDGLDDEVCDGLDNDGNGLVDDEPSDGIEWFRDADHDGFGDSADSVLTCYANPEPGEWVPNDSDCDDTNPARFPGASDESGDGVDQDCNGIDG